MIINYTICVYQHKVAFPDIVNWVRNKKKLKILKRIEKLDYKNLIFKAYKCELNYVYKNNDTIEYVYIVPDLFFEQTQKYFPNLNSLGNKKFVYIGAFRKDYIDIIINYYKENFI